MHRHHHHILPSIIYLTSWLLVLCTLLQGTHTEDCLVYCLKCGSNSDNSNYTTPRMPLRGSLEVSLQVDANGTLHTAQINVRDSSPSVTININNATVTLQGSQPLQTLTLPTPYTALSWITLVLDNTGHDNLLIYAPGDKHNVITTNTQPGSQAVVSAQQETHVAFNCVSGCLIRNSLSALIGRQALQPPFTMFLNPRPRSSQHPEPPVLTLTPPRGDNVTVDASQWAADTWHRVKVLAAEKAKRNMTVQRGQDGVTEACIWVTEGNYTLTRLKGFTWTLHCTPEGLMDGASDTGNNTDETMTSTLAPDGEGTEAGEGSEGNKSKQKTKGTAGAGQVAAWVMAGLAVFLVMILAFALCTRTARNTQPLHVQDNQPSVAVYFKNAASREPEEDSEPGTPNDLQVPGQRHSFRYSLKDRMMQE
ncbi:hypothetical protein GWK47_044024 [Chionoecetes opilio]|uniref:Uncharacterized protein n=1 Tax=Chionoecetes opilio TaxID=41210 RepID=A0A8J4Y7P5_CHIOP|nr:hypothetical protein GWK47_044024 [Chionoecetes opilio]